MSFEYVDNGATYFGKAAPGAVGGGSAKPKYVAELPEVGEEGVLYLVPTDVTRAGYQIFQEFIYKNGEWGAIGAYDVGVQAGGMVYERSFDTSTNTWAVTVNQVS